MQYAQAMLLYILHTSLSCDITIICNEIELYLANKHFCIYSHLIQVVLKDDTYIICDIFPVQPVYIIGFDLQVLASSPWRVC